MWSFHLRLLAFFVLLVFHFWCAQMKLIHRFCGEFLTSNGTRRASKQPFNGSIMKSGKLSIYSPHPMCFQQISYKFSNGRHRQQHRKSFAAATPIGFKQIVCLGCSIQEAGFIYESTYWVLT